MENTKRPMLRRLAGGVMAAAMAVSCFGGAVSAETTSSGYTTDEYGLMSYKFLSSGNLDMQGYWSGKWKKITYSNNGFSTHFILGEQTDEYFAGLTDTDSHWIKTSETPVSVGNDITVSVTPSIVNSGKQVKLTYKVTNNGTTDQVYSLGGAADIMIGSDDYAPITAHEDGRGFTMISKSSSDKDPETGEYAQLNFWCRNTIGTTDVSDFWFGHYLDRTGFNPSPSYTSYSKETCTHGGSRKGDSGLSYSWKNKTVAAGTTDVYTIISGVGGLGSEVLQSYSVTATTSSTEGGTASANVREAFEGETVSVTATPREGYRFVRWEVVTENTTVNSDGTFTMPAGDVHVKAIFARIAQDTHNITVTSTEGGRAAANVSTAAEGDIVALTATPSDGYRFVRWDVVTNNATVGSSNTFTMPAADVHVKAVFERTVVQAAKSYNVNVIIQGRGTATASHSSATAGTKVSISAAPSSGYVVKSISSTEGNVSIGADRTFTMPAADVTVLVVFGEDINFRGLPHSYIFCYDASGSRIGVASNKKFGAGNDVSITVKLGEGYAGMSYTLYNGKKSGSKIDSGVLDSNGRATITVPMGKNFHISVED